MQQTNVNETIRDLFPRLLIREYSVAHLRSISRFGDERPEYFDVVLVREVYPTDRRHRDEVVTKVYKYIDVIPAVKRVAVSLRTTVDISETLLFCRVYFTYRTDRESRRLLIVQITTFHVVTHERFGHQIGFDSSARLQDDSLVVAIIRLVVNGDGVFLEVVKLAFVNCDRCVLEQLVQILDGLTHTL